MNRALCERLRAHLGDRLLDREALVFTEPDGTPLTFGSFYSQRFKRAVRAVLPEHLHALRFHDLRHTYASLLVEQGAHPKEMADLMGHPSVQITLDRYSHVMPADPPVSSVQTVRKTGRRRVEAAETALPRTPFCQVSVPA